MTILYAISESGAEPSQLDRYRNEVAASLLGIQANKANSTGLLALRRLASTAPDPESDVIFLPDLRAVNVVKACQQWIASDEDIDEEVESAMTGIFLHLAPIVQNVPGAHWDFIFDVLESVLEVCSSSFTVSYPYESYIELVYHGGFVIGRFGTRPQTHHCYSRSSIDQQVISQCLARTPIICLDNCQGSSNNATR